MHYFVCQLDKLTFCYRDMKDRKSIRKAFLYFLCVLMLMNGAMYSKSTLAQFDKSVIAPSIVRVLILVDAQDFNQASQIIPTTGIVLNKQGQVLVDAEFTNQAKGLLVLDAGVDPVKHGIPASLVYINKSLGISVIQTQPLQHTPVTWNQIQPPSGVNIKSVGFDDIPGRPLLLDPVISDGRILQVNQNTGRTELGHDAVFGSGVAAGVIVNDCNQAVGYNLSSAQGSSGIAVGVNDVVSALQHNGISFQLVNTPCPVAVAQQNNPVQKQQVPQPAVAGQTAQTQQNTQSPAKTSAKAGQPSMPSVDPAKLKEAQVLLNALNIPAGNPDGKMGLKTRSAITVFQTSQNMPVDGRLSDELLDKLRSAVSGDKKTSPKQQPSQPAAQPQPHSQPPNQAPTAQTKASVGASNTAVSNNQAVATGTPTTSNTNQPQVQATGPSTNSQTAVEENTTEIESTQTESSSAAPIAINKMSILSWALLAGFVLLVLGVLIWWIMWQRKATRTPPVERASQILRSGSSPNPVAGAQLGGRTWSIYGETDEGHLVNLMINSEMFSRSPSGLDIGRSSRECEFIVDHDSVSRRHARLMLEGMQIVLEDLGSANGTRVNGQEIRIGEKRNLQDGSQIELGQVKLRFASA
ncbi:MAG: FHA domain-containing protein [Candidatus Thiodiazotropha taylori]